MDVALTNQRMDITARPCATTVGIKAYLPSKFILEPYWPVVLEFAVLKPWCMNKVVVADNAF